MRKTNLSSFERRKIWWKEGKKDGRKEGREGGRKEGRKEGEDTD